MELNNIGKINSTHGLKGELKIKTDSSFINERFGVGSKIYIKDNGKYKELEVIAHRSMHGFELVTFKGYEDVDKAFVLIHKEIYAEKKRELLKENEYFYSDYIGLNVLYFNKIVGQVISIESYPAGDYLKILSNGKEALVPLNKEFIENVDLKNKVLKIVDMEGLL